MTKKPLPPSVAAPSPEERAYGYFLRANEYHRPIEEPFALLEAARELDPSFAPTHAILARIHAWIYFNGHKPGESQRARDRIEQAKALAPDLPVVQLAEAYVANLLTNDPQAVLRLLENIPNREGEEFAEALMIEAVARMRQGSLGQALTLLKQLEEKLTVRAPRLGREHRRIHNCREVLFLEAEIHRARREFGLADDAFAEAMNVVPYDLEVINRRAMNLLEWKANSGFGQPSSEARDLLSNFSDLEEVSYGVRLLFDLYDAQEVDGAQEIYYQIVKRAEADPGRKGGPLDGAFYFWHEAFAIEKVRGEAAAREMVELCRSELEKLSRLMLQSGAEESRLTFCKVRARLAVAHAYLGDREKARVAIEELLKHVRDDPYYGPPFREHRARVFVLLGEYDSALDDIEALCNECYLFSIHGNRLGFEPIWLPLRGEERFRRLVSS